MNLQGLRVRVLIPLSLAVAILLISFAFAFYQFRQDHIAEDVMSKIKSVQELLVLQLDSDAGMMGAALEVIVRNEQLKTAFKARDRRTLLQLTGTLYHQLHSQHQITHFYFTGPDRVNILRVHQPDRHGDSIDRFTILTAEKTGKLSYGIELGPLGTFTLRAVLPWYDRGKLLGYVELGEEIEHITRKIRGILGVEIFILIEKKYLNREQWEAGMKMLGRKFHWDRFPNLVMAYQTADTVPQEFMGIFSADRQLPKIANSSVEVNGRYHRSAVFPLNDAGERLVGHMVIMRDVSNLIEDLRMTILLICGICLLIGGILFLLFYVYMGRVEKQLEITNRALRESEEVYRNILNSLEDSYVEVNLAGDITFFSPSVTRLLGYTEDELMGVNFRRLIDPSMTNEVLKAFQQIYQTGIAERHLLVEMARKDGSKLSVEMSASQLKDINGQVVGFFGIGRDMTEHQRAELELQRAKEAADAANRSKSVFLANMSHEIRTPMNAILGFAQLMQRDPNLTPQSREHLDIINRSGEHLLALINEVLEMSKIEAGRAIFVPNPFDLHALLNDIERMFRVQTDAKNLRFLMEMVGDVPRWVKTDEGKLRQIIINLLGNAVKFTDEGGIVLRLSGKTENGDRVNLRFEVEDTGPGMTDEEIGHLFKAFEQTQSGINIGGTGLGLALSRGFVEIMGGTISAISTVDKGTIFRFNILVQQASEEQASPKGTKRRVLGLRPGQSEIRVLIADDRETNRRLLSQMLATVGFSVEEAVNGVEVVRKTHEWKPGLILMDMAMPVMDGYEATRTIKASSDIMNTAIIAVTASAFEEDKQRIVAAGADGYLSKPFKDYELFEAVGRLTGAEYLYEDAADGVQAAVTMNEKELLQKTVASLPPDLVNEMRSAVESADVDLLTELAGQLAADHPAFVRRVQEMIDRYEYDALIELFSSGA